MDDVRIVAFDIAAYDEIVALWRQCEGVRLSESDEREELEAYLARNPGLSFVAVADGRIVGALLGGHDGRRGLLHHLAVHPEWRRRGIGGRLAEHSLQRLAEAGIRKCHLFIYQDNAAGIAFWERAGWRSLAHLRIMSRPIDAPGG